MCAALGMAASFGCARARATPAPTPVLWPQEFAFVAETGADSALQATVGGTATFDRGWLRVTVPRVVVTVPPGNPENWRNLTIRPFIATDYRPGDWKAVGESRPVNVFRFIDFSATRWSERRTVSVDQPLSFLVPIPPGAAPATSRLAFELEWVVVMGSFGDTDSRIAFSGPISTRPAVP